MKKENLINRIATRLALKIEDKYKDYNLDQLKFILDNEVEEFRIYLTNNSLKDKSIELSYFKYITEEYKFAKSVLFNAVKRDLQTIKELKA